jgi:archaemetzincin
MGIYFQCPVKILEAIPESVVPDAARREHPWRQMLTTYILDEILKPNLPEDAFALIGFTASDLWPGKGWNFVYGQVSLRSRVGVWSINRNGEPNLSEEDSQLCLLRTMKLATHETGHMFSMQHCIEYECNMCGSNHRAESDGKPLFLCGICLAKLLWATDADPRLRFERLRAFTERHNFRNEAEYYQKAIQLLSDQDASEPRQSDQR